MMKMRLIDADELKEQLKQCYENVVKWRGQTFYREKANDEVAAYLDAIRTVNNAPTVDAIPVVRCKDCKWAEDAGYAGCLYCNHPDGRNTIFALMEDFCNCGVRKDDNY